MNAIRSEKQDLASVTSCGCSKLDFSGNGLKSGDRECLPPSTKIAYRPHAMNFLRASRSTATVWLFLAEPFCRSFSFTKVWGVRSVPTKGGV
jgi:hypothetical protein